MLKTIIGIVVGVCLCSAQAFSETREEELVRLSKLTISAFECSVLTDGDDAKLAFFVGLKAGEGLWDGLRKLSTDEVRTIGLKIDKLWGMVKGGTTTEFVWIKLKVYFPDVFNGFCSQIASVHNL